MKPQRVTQLWIWMRERGYSDRDLAALLTREVGKHVGYRQVARWRSGVASPRKATMIALAKMSDNVVDANSFLAEAL